MWGNLSLDKVTKFAQDVLNDSAFNASQKEHLSDEEETSFDTMDDSESFNLTEKLNQLQEPDEYFDREQQDREIEQLREQLRSSRLETKSITKEFRNLLDIESREKKELQSNYNALKDQYNHLSDTLTQIDSQPHSSESGERETEKFELQKLHALLRSTQEENKRLTDKLEANKASEEDFFASELGDESMQRKIKELTYKMNQKEENFQQQLNSLQKIHQKKIQDLKQAHTEEMEQREVLGSVLDDSPLDSSDSKWEQKLKQLEDKYILKIQLAETKNEELSRELRETSENYQALTLSAKQQIERKTQEMNTILVNMESQHEEEQLQTLEQQDQLQAANSRLEKQIQTLKKSLQNKDEQINALADNSSALDQAKQQTEGNLHQLQATVASLQRKNELLTQQISTIQEEVSQLQQELTASISNCNETQAMNSELIQENQELDQTCINLRNQFDSVNIDTTKQQEIIAKLQEMNKTLLRKQDKFFEQKNQLNKLQEDLKLVKKERKQLKATNNQLHKETELLHLKLTDLESGASDTIQKKETTSSETTNNLQQQIVTLREQCTVEILAKQKLEQQLSTANDKLSQQIQSSKDTIQDLQNQLEQSQTALNETQTQNRSLQATITTKDSELAETQNLLESASNQNTTIGESEATQLREDLQTSQKNEAQSTRKIEELTMQLESMKESLNIFTQQEAQTRMQISMLEKKSAAAAAEANSRVQKLQSQLQDQIIQQESLLNEQIEQQQSFQSVKRKQDQELKDSHERIELLNSQVTEIQKKLLEKENEMKQAAEEHQIVFEALQEELRQELSKPTQDPTQLLEIEELQRCLEKANNQADQLTNHLLEKDNELIDLQDQIDGLTEESTKLKEIIRASEKQTEASLVEMKQLDGLQAELENKTKECEEKTTALLNLQSILEDKQAENEGRTQTQLNVLQRKYTKAEQELSEAKREIEILKKFRDSLTSANERVVNLQEELDGAQRDLQYARKEVDPLRNALNETLAQLSSFGSSEQNFIDKRIVTQLIVTYVTESKKEKKKEILQVMARILSWTEDEQVKVGLVVGNRSRWSMIPFWGGNNAETTANPSNSSNLVNMWVDFLLKESERAEQEEFAAPPAATKSPTE